MSSLRGRLIAELKDSVAHSDSNVKLQVEENDMLKWRAFIKGPEGSAYESGSFELSLACSRQFPIVAPSVRFVTPCFHPNIHWASGEVCVDILASAWSPAWSLIALCHALRSLLSDPNSDSPLNCDAGMLIRSGDIRAFESLAKYYTLDLGLKSIT